MKTRNRIQSFSRYLAAGYERRVIVETNITITMTISNHVIWIRSPVIPTTNTIAEDP